jgi:lipopolysaccharide transport protein LptA
MPSAKEFLIGAVICCSALVYAKDLKPDQAVVPQQNQPQEIPEPVNIHSDRLIVHQKERQAEFFGHVVTNQKNLLVRCEKLVITYAGAKDPDLKEGEIARMEFSGGVDIEQKNRKGFCQDATYERPAGRLICIGDPWVSEGGSRIKGERIEYLVNIDEVKVVKPRALIQVPAEELKKKGKNR